MARIIPLTLTLVILAIAAPSRANYGPTTVTAARAFPRLIFDRPIFLTSAGDHSGRLFVVEQGGKIKVFPETDSVPAAKVFLDISRKINKNGGELGLLGLAFDPDFERNGFFYVSYTTPAPIQFVVERFRVSADDPDRSRTQGNIIFSVPKNTNKPNHNGGMIAFGPDQLLYIGMGDGGGAGDPKRNGQNLRSPFGKILRIDPRGTHGRKRGLYGTYTIPRGNPYRNEVWAYGIRNPWRFSFDRQTGALWLGDVGQDRHEEVDVVVRGGNYGWNLWEGNEIYKNPRNVTPRHYVPPLYVYDHPPGVAVIGGYVYRGYLAPSLRGSYVFGDYGIGTVWALASDGKTVSGNRELAHVGQISAFGEDESGELFVVSYDGTLWRLVETLNSDGPEPPALLSLTGLFSDLTTLTPSQGVIEYDVNSPLWSDGAHKRRWISLPDSQQIEFQSTGPWNFPVGTRLVKHFELGTTRVETRLLIKRENSWSGYSYRWRADGSDADLLPGADNATYGSQSWHYPGRMECRSCHTQASGEVLGVITRQLNKDFNFPSGPENQLHAWNRMGLFTRDIGDPSSYDA